MSDGCVQVRHASSHASNVTGFRDQESLAALLQPTAPGFTRGLDPALGCCDPQPCWRAAIGLGPKQIRVPLNPNLNFKISTESFSEGWNQLHHTSDSQILSPSIPSFREFRLHRIEWQQSLTSLRPIFPFPRCFPPPPGSTAQPCGSRLSGSGFYNGRLSHVSSPLYVPKPDRKQGSNTQKHRYLRCPARLDRHILRRLYRHPGPGVRACRCRCWYARSSTVPRPPITPTFMC